jgi:MFS family permease
LGGLSTRERYSGLIWLVSAAFFMQALDSTIVNTAVPAMANALGESPLNMRSALTSYVLTLAILIPASPWLCDRFGTRKVFGVAISVFAIGSLLCGISQTLPELVMARVLQGCGGAALMPVGRYVLVRTIDKREFVQVMSTVATFGLLGSVLGPLLGGALVQYTSWRLIFLLNVPVGNARCQSIGSIRPIASICSASCFSLPRRRCCWPLRNSQATKPYAGRKWGRWCWRR